MSFIPKVILITGASSGLGAALAEQYATEGVTLYLAARNNNRLEDVASKCRAKGAEVITKSNLDVVDGSAMESFIKASDSYKNIDLVIANAGISAGTGGGGESDEQVRKIFAVNIDGVLNTIQPLVPLMSARGQGQIAIVSSLAGYRGLPSCPAYSASKAAVRSYGEAIRGSLKENGIKVSVIMPGYVKTPMTDLNEFPMPMLMQSEKAARLIQRKLQKNTARIVFSFPFCSLVWLTSCISPAIIDPILSLLPKKQ
jgi:short-subunit dehydrogenase